MATKRSSEGSCVNQIICAILINVPVFAYGASMGWMSPMTLLLQSENSPRGTPLTDIEVSWLASVAYLVCIPCDFILAILSDKIGRKKSLLLTSLANAVSWVLLLVSTQFWALLLARAFVGFSMAGSFVTCSMYTKEISDDNIRGALGSLIILFQTTGNLFMYIIGDMLGYHTILWICLSIPTLHIIIFMMMPESPSYLVKRKKLEEVKRVIAWLKHRKEGDSLITAEVQKIQKEQENDSKCSEFLLKDIFKDKVMRRAYGIAMAVTLAREVCGAIPILNYAGDIFTIASRDSNLILSPNQQAMFLGAVQVAGSIIASSCIEKAGRKFLFFGSALISGLSMCVLASWFLARDYGVLVPSWVPMVTMCLCIFCDSAGLAPISLVIAGEIFSFKYRATVMATTLSTTSVADFIQLLFFKPLASAVGIHVAFYFFGIFCVIISAYTLLYVPETKSRSLDDIYQDLMKRKKKTKEIRAP
ncbi:unnamed protein product [Leptidea sinapis]|uniref:Major facilitator superfamily (MFS) profile domain-containing protein n=1 Tax=Leptidea sinapis TaxID=189913 RepID=A0A5E4QQ97_9NEOP|nr:unnamed protein product [Leptidea sinapis]